MRVVPLPALPACGCGCHFGPSLFQDAAPEGGMEPLISKRASKSAEEVKSKGKNTWSVQPFCIVLEMF